MKNNTQVFLNALEHIIVAYVYCESCIPADELFANGQTVKVGATLFSRQDQAFSMRVELGWAFFTRMEACLESLIHDLKIPISKKMSLLDYLKERGCPLSPKQEEGLKVYREIRNTLHHADGQPSKLKRTKPVHLTISEGNEVHVLRDQIRLFYELFKYVGIFLTKDSTFSDEGAPSPEK